MSNGSAAAPLRCGGGGRWKMAVRLYPIRGSVLCRCAPIKGYSGAPIKVYSDQSVLRSKGTPTEGGSLAVYSPAACSNVTSSFLERLKKGVAQIAFGLSAKDLPIRRRRRRRSLVFFPNCLECFDSYHLCGLLR